MGWDKKKIKTFFYGHLARTMPIMCKLQTMKGTQNNLCFQRYLKCACHFAFKRTNQSAVFEVLRHVLNVVDSLLVINSKIKEFNLIVSSSIIEP